MSLATEIFILAFAMTLFCFLPLFSAAARKYSKYIFLIGTGAMFGICFFDLIPDVIELGGSTSLYVIGLVWLLYTVIHVFHLGHHHGHEQESGHDGRQGSGILLFFGSLVAHCFASGMLLTVSHGLSTKIASTVFAALLAHKIYESLLLSSILITQSFSATRRTAYIAVYAAALPLGALVTSFFQSSINTNVAVLISSIAVGTLMGCLIFDFLLPSFRQLREQRYKAGWLIVGLVLTQVVMRQL